MLTGILPRDVPKRLPGAVSIYSHGIHAGIDLIRKNTPSPCVQLRKKDIRQKERVGESEEGKVNSILFARVPARNARRQALGFSR